MKKQIIIKNKISIANLILYDLLLIATPFLMIQNYLQQTIREISNFTIHFGINIPVVVIVLIIFLLSLFIVFRKEFNLFRIKALAIILLMIIVSQYISDYYLNYHFYDLQNNWHYLAYGILSYLVYITLKPLDISDNIIILFIFFKALIISSIDETIQLFISNRVFDISDIAKDVWGMLIGVIFIYFVIRQGDIIKSWNFRQKKIIDYFKKPFSIIVLEVIFGLIFLSISSVLTDISLLLKALTIIVFLFVSFFVIIHLSQYKIAKRIILYVFVLAIIFQGYSVFKNYDRGTEYSSSGIIVYKGFALPYFDFMIYPNGFFRFVDKKTFFKGGDFYTFFKQKADILLIATGSNGEGGQGFSGSQFVENSYFIYNPINNKAMQIVRLKTNDACSEFNRLKSQGYNVLFVVHNE